MALISQILGSLIRHSQSLNAMAKAEIPRGATHAVACHTAECRMLVSSKGKCVQSIMTSPGSSD